MSADMSGMAKVALVKPTDRIRKRMSQKRMGKM
jgi:hypothetical protein